MVDTGFQSEDTAKPKQGLETKKQPNVLYLFLFTKHGKMVIPLHQTWKNGRQKVLKFCQLSKHGISKCIMDLVF